jgi:hypothetical protein
LCCCWPTWFIRHGFRRDDDDDNGDDDDGQDKTSRESRSEEKSNFDLDQRRTCRIPVRRSVTVERQQAIQVKLVFDNCKPGIDIFGVFSVELGEFDTGQSFVVSEGDAETGLLRGFSRSFWGPGSRERSRSIY